MRDGNWNHQQMETEECLLSLTCRGSDCESKTKREITMIIAVNKPVKPYLSCNKYSLSRTMDAGTAALEMSYWKDLRRHPFNVLVLSGSHQILS